MISHRQDIIPHPNDIKTYIDIVDSDTSHTILKFIQITLSHKNMTALMDNNQIEEGHGPTTITVPQGINILIK